MTLRERILKEHSKANCQQIINWIGKSQQRFDKLVELFLHDEPIVVQRAGWPMSYVACSHPDMVQKHIGKLLRNLRKKKLHDAVKRNIVRLLQHVPVPVKFHGEMMNTCFDYIASSSEAAAIKAFSLTVLENLSKLYPEIRKELNTIIKDRWDYETAAFKCRAKKLLREHLFLSY